MSSPGADPDPEATLFALTTQMAEEGQSLVPRVVPPSTEYRQWDHYPKGDAISPSSKARWFYHAHPPEQRAAGEHGHFHLFLPLIAFEGVKPLAAPAPRNKSGKTPAKTVHLIALSFNTEGQPTQWFTTNRWVTNEYILPASAIIERMSRFDVRDAANADLLVNGWLTAAVALFRDEITTLLQARDLALEDRNFEDRNREILSRANFAL